MNVEILRVLTLFILGKGLNALLYGRRMQITSTRLSIIIIFLRVQMKSLFLIGLIQEQMYIFGETIRHLI